MIYSEIYLKKLLGNQIIEGLMGLLFTAFWLFLKDAQDLGISIELLPLSQPDKQFNITLFYKVNLLTIYFLC